MQDFVQSTEDGETPQEWLHRIMGSLSRESDDHSINLLGKKLNDTFIRYDKILKKKTECFDPKVSSCKLI